MQDALDPTDLNLSHCLQTCSDIFRPFTIIEERDIVSLCDGDNSDDVSKTSNEVCCILLHCYVNKILRLQRKSRSSEKTSTLLRSLMIIKVAMVVDHYIA